MNLVDIFWDAFPLSFALLFGVFAVIYWILTRMNKGGEAIENEVELFFKGNTVQSFPAVIEKDIAIFKIGETEYREPIISKPRLRVKKKDGKERIFRTYLYAEGLGSIDVPPLTTKGREAIKNVLIANNIIDEEKVDNFDDNELIEFVQFYNFDIEQLQDKPMLRAFSTSMNMYASTMEFINTNMKALTKNDGGTLRILLVGLLFFGLGLFAGLYLATKGYM